jgi:hypothetical protein
LILLSREQGKGEGGGSHAHTGVGLLGKASLSCENEGQGLQETGLYKLPASPLSKLGHIEGEGGGEVLYPETDGTMVYVCDNTAAGMYPRPGAERMARMDSAALDPRPSGSVRIHTSQQEQADEVVAQALRRCQEEQHGANAERRRQQEEYVPFPPALFSRQPCISLFTITLPGMTWHESNHHLPSPSNQSINQSINQSQYSHYRYRAHMEQSHITHRLPVATKLEGRPRKEGRS